MQAWSPRRFSHVYKHSREATGSQDLAAPGAVRAPGGEAGGPDGARLGHLGLEGTVMGAWSPCSPATQGEPWTERHSSESQRPVRAGHRAPRHSHRRRLPPPWGPPDTPTEDAPPPLGTPPVTPIADASPPPSGAQLRATSRGRGEQGTASGCASLGNAYTGRTSGPPGRRSEHRPAGPPRSG